MSEHTFQNDLIQRVQNNILNQISKMEFLKVDYQERPTLPKQLINDCYAAIDMERVKTLIVARLEEEVAEKIVNKLLTEYSNDVKQIMSNTELREDLRGILRAKIKETKALLE